MTADRDLEQRPALTVVRGNPSAEEVAALVVVLARARRAPTALVTAGPGGRSEWSSRSRMLRTPLERGPGAWRASALPR
jgi:hypothetical protein